MHRAPGADSGRPLSLLALDSCSESPLLPNGGQQKTSVAIRGGIMGPQVSLSRPLGSSLGAAAVRPRLPDVFLSLSYSSAGDFAGSPAEESPSHRVARAPVRTPDGSRKTAEHTEEVKRVMPSRARLQGRRGPRTRLRLRGCAGSSAPDQNPVTAMKRTKETRVSSI